METIMYKSIATKDFVANCEYFHDLYMDDRIESRKRDELIEEQIEQLLKSLASSLEARNEAKDAGKRLFDRDVLRSHEWLLLEGRLK